MKKLKQLIYTVISLMIVSVLLSANVLAEEQENVFIDVDIDNKNSVAIYTLAEEGIIDGVLQEDNTYAFFPEQTITRAEVSKMIALALTKNDESKLSDTTNDFYDLPETHWANKYVAYAVNNEIIDGCEDSSFKPTAPATYGEVAKMLVCAKGYKGLCQLSVPWYDSYISIANELHITKNVENTGDKEATRAQVAQMIYNLRETLEIPKLYFEGNISQMYEKSDVRDIAVTYICEENFFKGYAKIKVQGSSSLAYDKKNYTINLYEDSLCSEKMKVDVGWGSQNKYCLKANWIDKTHARNIVTAQIISQVQEKYGLFNDTPANGVIDGFPVEIYSNGEFLGIYTFNIPKDEWMFGMDSDNPNHIVLCGEAWSPKTLFTESPDLEMWSVEVGPESDETLLKFDRICQFIINSSDEEFKQNFCDYIDIDAALNYYIMSDIACLRDNLGKNMLMVTYDGVKWYPSLYDLDTSWGTRHDGKELFDYDENLVSMNWNNLFKRMEECFSDELSQRYFELRKEILTKENIISKFEQFEDSIPQETFDKETKRWGSEIPGFDIAQIAEYLDSVICRLDQKYLDLASK